MTSPPELRTAADLRFQRNRCWAQNRGPFRISAPSRIRIFLASGWREKYRFGRFFDQISTAVLLGHKEQCPGWPLTGLSTLVRLYPADSAILAPQLSLKFLCNFSQPTAVLNHKLTKTRG